MVLLLFMLLQLAFPQRSAAQPAGGKDELSNQLLNLADPLVLKCEEPAARVAAVGATLIKARSRVPSHAFRFHVMASSPPNSFSTPNGDVFVTTGLLDLLKSADELAIVLAREIEMVESEVAWREYVKARDAGNTAAWAGGGLALAVVGAGLVTQMVVAPGVPLPHSLVILAPGVAAVPVVAHQSGWNEALARSQAPAKFRFGRPLTATAFDVFLLKLLEDGYAPGVELEVDRKALNLAREAGYSPAALVSLLEKFTMGGGSWSSHLESAAPGLERRIAQAERLVGYRKAKGGGPSR
jgi:hypothetical protein